MSFVMYKGTRIIKEWPVKISVAGDGGSLSSSQMTVDLTLLTKGDFDAAVAAAKGGAVLDVDAEVLKSLIIGWSGVVDETGAEVPFSVEALSTLSGMPNARAAIYDAYFEAGAGKAAAKN